ncbi:zinc finger protein 862-like [Mytilus californianus]|uniref:zinc finger protein 862-like n=1 Tax=Mytilus californianus TaxID=6549 RepID=UPI002245C707|nr:zinc finger protein 862-like [Mytilus californianus]
MLLDTLPHLNRLSKLFQKTSIDFSMVDTLVSSTQLVLTNLLDNPGPNTKDIATYFNSLEEYGVKYKQTEIDRFQEQVYQPFINNVISNLHDRFPDTSVLDSFSVFDPDLLDQKDPSTNEYLQFQKLKQLAKQFPSVGTSDTAEEEFTSLRYIIASKMKDQTTRQVLEKTAKMTDLYPVLSKYCQIALVVPVSTADCERTFSTLNRVKSILRNRLSQHILNCLMTISTEGPSLQNFDFQACVTAFAQKKKRKLNL